MDWSLLAEVAGLGFAAIDAIGIAFMPILLAQAEGLRRASVFLLGSFVALVAMGLLFTTGIGPKVAAFNEENPWLEPTVEVAGGAFLLIAGIVMIVRSRTGGTHVPDNLVEKLTLPMPLLFGFGVVLVTIQSLVDVVFAVAMVEVGAKDPSFVVDVILVLTYTVCALALQAAVVVAYLLTPHARRERAMAAFTSWLTRRGEFWAGWAALLVGIGLLGFSIPELIHDLDS